MDAGSYHATPSRRCVGCVPFVNGRPLVWAFEQPEFEWAVTVRYDMPSRLPLMLMQGGADAVLASSIEALIHPNRRIAAGIGVVSDGPVESVRLFSKVPFGQIESLALDQSSLTSNALAQILLKEINGAVPSCEPMPPSLDQMLSQHDAAVLIGDIGMRADGSGLYVMDMGEAWTQFTGLPFVWALWIGESNLTEDLAQKLKAARSFSGLGAGTAVSGASDSAEVRARIDSQVQTFARASGWTSEEVERYLTQVIRLDVDERALEGLRLFQRKLREHGHATADFPEIVHPRRELAAGPRGG